VLDGVDEHVRIAKRGAGVGDSQPGVAGTIWLVSTLAPHSRSVNVGEIAELS
jgi:hypothetical protein